MGGLPRRATFIKQEISDGVPTLILDSGNLFTKKVLSEPALENAVRKGELILRAMETMGYKAAAVGEMDLYLGRENLDRLAGSTSVKFLSANLKSANGRPVYSPYTITTVGKIKVGIFGLTSRDVDVKMMEQRFPGVWVDDPITTASALLPKLRKKTDLIVALTHIGVGKDKELARSVKGIDVIVGGKSRTWLKNPLQVRSTLITSGYFQGRAMGRLFLSFRGKHAGWTDGNRIDFLEEQLQVLEKGGDVLPGVPGDREGLTGELDKARSMTRIDGDMITLTERFGDDRQIASFIRDYRKELKKQAQARAVESVTSDTPDRYLGTKACVDCHRTRSAFWAGTAHARALSALVPKGAEADHDCLPCHVTGYLKPTGYTPAAPRPDLVNVQCEACHGKGSLHVSSPDIYGLIKMPPASICLGCHIADHDDDFDYIRDRRLVCEDL